MLSSKLGIFVFPSGEGFFLPVCAIKFRGLSVHAVLILRACCGLSLLCPASISKPSVKIQSICLDPVFVESSWLCYLVSLVRYESIWWKLSFICWLTPYVLVLAWMKLPPLLLVELPFTSKLRTLVLVSGSATVFLLGLIERLGCVKLREGILSFIRLFLISSITAKGEVIVDGIKSNDVTFFCDSRVWAWSW